MTKKTICGGLYMLEKKGIYIDIYYVFICLRCGMESISSPDKLKGTLEKDLYMECNEVKKFCKCKKTPNGLFDFNNLHYCN